MKRHPILSSLVAACASCLGLPDATHLSGATALSGATRLTACRATGTSVGHGSASAEASPVEGPEQGQRAVGSPKSPFTPDGVRGDGLTIWYTKEFRRRFAESYLATSDVEPRLDSLQQEELQKIFGLISNDELDAAMRLLDKHVGDKASAAFDLMRANVLIQQEGLADAAVALESAVAKFPRFLRAWQNLGMVYARIGQHARAIRPLTRVIELGGGTGITYGLLGFSYSSVGNEISAESALRMAMILDPETPDWKMHLARSFFRQRRYADAVALCDVLIEEQPDSAELWTLQATAYIGVGDAMRAAQNYELVERMGGATAESLNNLADIYAREKLFGIAVDTYVRAMKKDPINRPERALLAARVLASGNSMADARRLIDGIESLHGVNLDARERTDLLKMRARMAVAEGAGEEEVRLLEQVVALDPLDGEGLVFLGEHYERAGDKVKAINYFERAENIDASEALAKLRHGQLLVREGKYREALPLLRRSQQRDPKESVQQFLEQVERIVNKR